MLSKRKILMCLGVALIFGVTNLIFSNSYIVTVNATQNCSSEAECRDVIENTKDELEQLNKEEANKENELAGVELDIESLLTRIEETEKEIIQTTNEIKKTEDKIEKSEEVLDVLNEDILGVKEDVAVKMRLSQRLSRFNIILNFLSEAESLTDLIRSMRTINYFAQSDSEQMDKLSSLVKEQQEIKESLQIEKESLALSQKTLVDQQKELEQDQQALEKKRADVKEQIQAIESEKMSAADALEIAQAQKALLEKLAAEEEARRIEEEKRKEEEALQNQNNNNSNSGSDSSTGNGNTTTQPVAKNFIIPLATGYVSCEYMCYPNHTGIDLANSGNTNTPVIASASGVVVRSGWHSAYGNHVIISHNVDGRVMTTVYAHMHSTPLVSAGSIVSQGQKLGTMGNTGNSFGAHLHFEIYEGYYNYPYAQNPRNYINFPSRW